MCRSCVGCALRTTCGLIMRKLTGSPLPKLIIDSREIEVPQGTNVLEAAERLGIMIPRFCYHPALGSVGACRMCAVKFLEGPVKGVEMSCMVGGQGRHGGLHHPPGRHGFPEIRHRVAHAEPPPGLPGVRRRGALPAPGRNRLRRPRHPALPGPQAHLSRTRTWACSCSTK